MAKTRYDGVIEAVRYKPEGRVEWVRAYLRRGPIFSDYILLQRQPLIDLIKQGKHFVTGRRVPYQANAFEISEPLQVVEKSGRSILVAGAHILDSDNLPGVPQI